MNPWQFVSIPTRRPAARKMNATKLLTHVANEYGDERLPLALERHVRSGLADRVADYPPTFPIDPGLLAEEEFVAYLAAFAYKRSRRFGESSESYSRVRGRIRGTLSQLSQALARRRPTTRDQVEARWSSPIVDRVLFVLHYERKLALAIGTANDYVAELDLARRRERDGYEVKGDSVGDLAGMVAHWRAEAKRLGDASAFVDLFFNLLADRELLE